MWRGEVSRTGEEMEKGEAKRGGKEGLGEERKWKSRGEERND